MAVMDDNNNFMRYVYRGEDDEVIPREATHITVGEDVTVILAYAFKEHPNIIEIIFHADVEKIERYAFAKCPNLRRVIMPGIKIAGYGAFAICPALADVECGKLEIIEKGAFGRCKSLRGINLSSARVIKEDAFFMCEALADATFSNKLEIIEGWAFLKCTSLERIAIPLKDHLIADDDVFQGCKQLKHVDLIEGELHETIAALHLDGWRDDMNEEIDSIKHILPDTRVGYFTDIINHGHAGEMVQEIRWWIRRVLGKIIHYQAKHQHILDEAANTLQISLPHDIVFNNILSFLALPSHTFEVEEYVYREMQEE